jgi:hypothetical protein
MTQIERIKCFTYAFCLGLVELCPQHVELVQGLLLRHPHLLDKILLLSDDLVRLLLMLLDDVGVVSLALHLKLVVLLLQVQSVLLVQLDLIVVTLLDSLQVLHHWLLGDVIGRLEVTSLVLGRVLDLEDSSLKKSKIG